MAKGRTPEQGKDIGAVRVTKDGTVWVTKKEAEIQAKKNKTKARKVRGGYLAPGKSN